MSLWHVVSAAPSEGKDDHVDVKREDEASQAQWKRDFEEDQSGIIGDLRDRIRQAQRDSVLPPTGADIRVRHLHYISPPLPTTQDALPRYIARKLNFIRYFKDQFAPDPSRCRTILKNLNFDLAGGSMTLVIGSPGSGKSSLCRVLANQDVMGRVEGQLLCGGQPIRRTDHAHRVAYVRDCDIHLPHLTVRQTFEFADAMLTNSTSEARNRKVNAIMEILGLSHRANTIVGDDLTRGVSGGERRRVTVGVELMKPCQIMIMDEATTGLDSTTSLQIFRALRVIADEMAPVFATLKQPGRDLFALFDNVIVMHAGQIAYYGPCTEMGNYLEAAGYSMHSNINPADEVLALVDEHGDELVQLFQHKLEADRAEEADDYSSIHGSTEGFRPPTKPALPVTVPSDFLQVKYPRYSRSLLMQYLWGVKRGVQLFQNNPGIELGRIFFAILMALIIGTLFLQLGDEQGDIGGIQGSLFMVASFPAFQALASLPTVYTIRPVFYYQRKNSYYRALPSLLADFTVSLPTTLIESAGFATICYWLIGFNPLFVRYLLFVLMVVSLEVLFSILTKMAGFVLPTFQVANIVIPPLVFMMNFFTGFAILQARAPIYMQWLFWVFPFRYLFEGLMINQMMGTEFTCANDELIPPSSHPRFALPFASGGFESQQICPVTEGEQILEALDFEVDWAFAWYWFLVIQAYIVGAFTLMILSSYRVFQSPPPRDLTHAEEKRAADNLKVQAFKESLWENGQSLPGLGRLSQASMTEESNQEDSPRGLLGALEGQQGGNRIQTNVPIVLEWRNVRYTVPVAPKDGYKAKLAAFPCIAPLVQEELLLLDDVSGYVKPGMLIAFMGPSGAGKTTLLDVLSQRKTAGKFEGEILINGAPMDPDLLSRFAGYVEQQNIHVGTETVEEALMLSASLRLSYPEQLRELNKGDVTISRREKIDHILWVMEVLALGPLRDALINELSLEQKKRVTIGVELAANPSLLWLDEPTSGLDSMAALCVMRAVKKIADSGVAVVCTLHQPSELLFSWCTHLLLLAPGGRVTFFGESGDNNHEAKQHFSQFGLAPNELQNDADFFLDCCSSSATNEAGETPAEAYRSSAAHKELQETLEHGLAPRATVTPPPWYSSYLPFLSSKPQVHWEDRAQRGTEMEDRAASCMDEHDVMGMPLEPPVYATELARWKPVQVGYLVIRNARVWWRQPVPLLIMWFNALLFGLILGLLFSEMDRSQQGAQEHISIFFFLALVMGTSALTFIPQIFSERATFYRETLSKTYTPRMYMVALIMVTLPLIFINSMIPIILTWSIAGLGMEWWQVWYLWGAAVSISIVSYGFALVLACLSPVPELGNLMFSIINIVNAMTNGFLLLRTRIPGWWIWAYWAGYQHYGLEGLLLNELQGQEYHCRNNNGAIPIPVPSASNPLRVQYYCRFQSGEDVLESVAAHENLKMVDIFVMVGFIAALLGASIFVVSKVRHIKR